MSATQASGTAHERSPPAGIASVVLPDYPSITVARVELGLTLYLDDAMHWARQGAERVLRSFLAIVPPDHLSWYSTSRMEGWRKLEGEAMGEVARMLSLGWSEGRPRHLFELTLTDDVEAPSCGFRYGEIDPRRADRVGVIEVTLPQECHPGYLLPIARAAVEAGPLWAGVGGYAVRLGESFRADAFDVAWAWSQRFVGLDIQDHERMAWAVREGLPGTGWLTILGSALMAAREVNPEAPRAHPWTDPTITTELASGNLLIKAGEAPTLGDRNFFEDAPAYREVAHAAADLFVADPPELLGHFRDRRGTRAWFRRLLAPVPPRPNR